MYISLARKYRPKSFSSVAVQSHVSNTLRGAIARGRVAHGYLLCGPRGVGKTTLARVLAMALNCERRSALGDRRSAPPPPHPESRVPSPDPGEPCGECPTCQRIWAGSSSLDVVEIDAASNRGVDDARELRERAMYAPSTDVGYKVYIVDEAHMLTREAWNALLKILEEPPPRVIFVFATTEPQKIAQTAAPVLSRLQRFDLRRIGASEIRDRVAAVLAAERIEAEAEALALIARTADGSLRDALSLTDQVLSLGSEDAVTSARVREALGLVAEDEYLAILDLIANRRAAEIFPAVERLIDGGVDLGTFLAGLADMLRAQLSLQLGGAADDVSESVRAALRERQGALREGDILRMLAAVTELEPRFRRSGQQRLLLETLLVRFALMDRTVSLEELLHGLNARTEGDVAGHQLAPGSADAVANPTSVEPGSEWPASAAAAPTLTAGTQHQLRALDLPSLLARWDAIVEEVRIGHGGLLAAAVPAARPVAVSVNGDISLEIEGSNEIYERAIEREATVVLASVRAHFSGVGKLVLRRGEPALPSDAPRRLTEEAIRGERLAGLRKRDPALDAAVDALDLELLD